MSPMRTILSRPIFILPITSLLVLTSTIMSMAQITFPTNTLSTIEQTFLTLPVPPHGPRSSLPVANSTKPYWLYSQPDANPLAKVGSEGPLVEDADVCIIGSGITGVSTALHLAKQMERRREVGIDGTPLRVVILEARDFCSGATGRNGGHLMPRSFFEFSTVQTAHGTDEARRSSLIEDHTTQSILGFLRDHEVEEYVDLVTGGHIALFVTPEEEALARADYAAAQQAGLDVSQVQWIGAEEMNAAYGTPYPGVLSPGHNLWPSKLVTKLYEATAAQTSYINLTLHTNTPVTAITSTTLHDLPSSLVSPSSMRTRRRHILHTPRGPINCTSVIHATNAYASYLLPSLGGPGGIVPTRGQVVALRAAVSADEITRRSWYGNEGFEYWFPRPVPSRSLTQSLQTLSISENHGSSTQKPLNSNLVEREEQNPIVILGGGREAESPSYEFYNSDDSTVGARAGKVLREFLPGLYPGKYEAGREPEMEWTGIMGFTKTGDPFVGPIPSVDGPQVGGQFIAAGYHGHGMPRAFACAEAIASIVIHELSGGKFEDWVAPEWLPERYLTRSRGGAESSSNVSHASDEV